LLKLKGWSTSTRNKKAILRTRQKSNNNNIDKVCTCVKAREWNN
jgi:hypothetical protein